MVVQVDDSETEDDPETQWRASDRGNGALGKVASSSAMDVDSQEAPGGHGGDEEDDSDEEERDEVEEAAEAAAREAAHGIGCWWAWAYNARTGLRRCLGTDALGRRYWLMAGRAGAYQVRCVCAVCVLSRVLRDACTRGFAAYGSSARVKDCSVQCVCASVWLHGRVLL